MACHYGDNTWRHLSLMTCADDLSEEDYLIRFDWVFDLFLEN